MNHSFNIKNAEKYGILEAVIIENILFWIKKNVANNTNRYDNRTWTFNSVKAWSELFPYVSQSQIRRALDNLVNQDVLIKGNYNKLKMDRTAWYAFKNEEMHLFLNSNHLPYSSNAFDQSVKAIPDINTDINTDININKEEEIFPFKIGEIEVGSIQEYVSKYARLRSSFERIFLDSGFPNYEPLVDEFEKSLSGFADFTDDNHLKNSFKKFITYKQKEEKEKSSAQKENDNGNTKGKYHPSTISEFDNRPKRRFIAGEEL